MSTSNTPPATFIWAVVVMFLGAVAGIVALAVGLPESQNPAGLGAQILMAFAALVGVLANLYKSERIERGVKQVAQDTSAIRNGEMEGKLHGVLDERDRRAEQ